MTVLGLAIIFLSIVPAPVRACTIFVLTDDTRALFCNNEDYSNPKTRMWFIPASNGHHGCVLVGFDDGFAQGGVNTEGLALDWVAGYAEKWEPDATVPDAGGYSGQRVLETCSTVQEAIAFYRSHREPGFSFARILIADRTGASVIIGAKHGKLQVEQANQCRGFGYGGKTLDKTLAQLPEPTEANGFKILRASAQKGKNATKYSTIYDLKSGDVFLVPLLDHDDKLKFNLADELRKGGHYYDMPQMNDQLAQAVRPLLANMRRQLLDRCNPIQDNEPAVTTHVRSLIQGMCEGTLHNDDFSAELWKNELPDQKKTQEIMRSFGDFVSMSLVDCSDEDGKRLYRYRLKFKKAILLQNFAFDQQHKLTASDMEDLELKMDPNADVK